MATTIGVRSCRASTPVPRSSDGAAAPAAASAENASGPVVSAAQNDGSPSRSASRAVCDRRLRAEAHEAGEGDPELAPSPSGRP